MTQPQRLRKARRRERQARSRAYLLAFQVEFPWLFEDGLVDSNRLETVVFLPLERELLDQVPSWGRSESNLSDRNDRQRYLVFDQDGRLLVEVAPDYEHWTPRETYSESGETVADAILRASGQDSAYWIVEVHTGWRVFEHYSVGGYDVRVFEDREGELREWLAERVLSASEDLAQDRNVEVSL